jgi:fumarylpyruvate hydrolase
MFRAASIYGVGWNYAAHNREMGRPDRPEVVFFQKSLGSVARPARRRKRPGTDLFRLTHPRAPRELGYEGELVVLIGTGGARIHSAIAHRHIAGYAAGLDLTLRDVQREVRAQGKPWFPAKNFPGSTVVGSFVPTRLHPRILSSSLILTVNGEVRQHAALSEMLNTPAQLISILSFHAVLMPGDLIFTGTPSGIGNLSPGDVVELEVTGLPPLRLEIDGHRSDARD